MEQQKVNFWMCLAPAMALALLACGDRGKHEVDIRRPGMVTADSAAAPKFMDGMQEILGNDGTLRMKGELRQGIRHGPWSSFYPDGSLRSKATYVNGLQEGITEVYHENGTTYYSGQYHNDKPVGRWVFYGVDGMLLRSVQYDSLGNLLDQR